MHGEQGGQGSGQGREPVESVTSYKKGRSTPLTWSAATGLLTDQVPQARSVQLERLFWLKLAGFARRMLSWATLGPFCPVHACTLC